MFKMLKITMCKNGIITLRTPCVIQCNDISKLVCEQLHDITNTESLSHQVRTLTMRTL